MALYDLVFTGELIDGCEPARVRRDLERLFKADAASISRLFTGKPVVIKKGIDEATARRYRDALQQVGALCQLRPVPGNSEGAGDAAPAARVAAPPVAAGLAGAAILPPGSVLAEARAVTPAEYDLTGLSIAPPGTTLVEKEVGDHAPPPVPGRFDLAPPGADIGMPRRMDPVPIPDIGKLTMAAPGTEVLSPEERDRPQPPPPDAGDLSLAD